jgi:hypothetical protein
MRWAEVRTAYPDQWLVIEALEAHTELHRRVLDRIAVVDRCPDGATAMKRYRALHHEHPERELSFVHTGNAELDIVERYWVGIRRNDSARNTR